MININSYSGRTTGDIISQMSNELGGTRGYIEEVTLAYNPNTGKMEAILVYSDDRRR